MPGLSGPEANGGEEASALLGLAMQLSTINVIPPFE